jgi:hypothetical protein
MIQIYLSNLHCHEETDEVGADEPYVLVTGVDLAASVSVAGFPVPLPAFEVVRYGPFEDVDDEETPFAPGISQSFWGVTGRPATLDNPDQVIFVVALMENDDGDPEALRGIVKGIVGGSVLGTLSLDRTDKVTALIRDVNSALGTPTGAPNFDDKVGDPQELRFSREELVQAESGQTVSKTLAFEGDGGRYALTFEVRKTVPVAFNPQDRFVAVMGNRILVFANGAIFAHEINGNTIGPAFRLNGPPAAFNPQDRFVAVMGNRILVFANGAIFAHEINGNTIGPAFRLNGPPAAFNPQDRFVAVMGNRILVFANGAIFAHEINGNTIGPAFRLNGPPAAFRPQDRFVVVMGNRILILVNGEIHAHEINGNTIGPGFRLNGPPAAFRPQDRFVVVMGNRILVLVNGPIFAHDINGNTIGAGFQLT